MGDVRRNLQHFPDGNQKGNPRVERRRRGDPCGRPLWSMSIFLERVAFSRRKNQVKVYISKIRWVYNSDKKRYYGTGINQA